MTALAAPRTLAPGWWRTLFATALGLFFAGVVTTILQARFAAAVGWPDPWDGVNPPGVGWPSASTSAAA